MFRARVQSYPESTSLIIAIYKPRRNYPYSWTGALIHLAEVLIGAMAKFYVWARVWQLFNMYFFGSKAHRTPVIHPEFLSAYSKGVGNVQPQRRNLLLQKLHGSHAVPALDIQPILLLKGATCRKIRPTPTSRLGVVNLF